MRAGHRPDREPRIACADRLGAQDQRFRLARKRTRLRATAVQRRLRDSGDARCFSFRHIFFRHAPATVARIRVGEETVARAPETAFDFLEIREHELEN